MDISTLNTIRRNCVIGRKRDGASAGKLAVIAATLIVVGLLEGRAFSDESPDPAAPRSAVVWQDPSPDPEPPVGVPIESEVVESLPSPSGPEQEPERLPDAVRDEPVPPLPESAESYVLPDREIEKLQDISIHIGVPDRLKESADEAAAPAATYFGAEQPYSRHTMVHGPGYVQPAYGPDLNFCYRPLYFEEMNLERYGHSRGIFQPAVSAARFYTNTLVLPYRLVRRKPCYCTYHDHYSRPGASAPPERHLHGH